MTHQADCRMILEEALEQLRERAEQIQPSGAYEEGTDGVLSSLAYLTIHGIKVTPCKSIKVTTTIQLIDFKS